jgi:hypothetical protein
MLNVVNEPIMPSVVMLIVVMLNVMAPSAHSLICRGERGAQFHSYRGSEKEFSEKVTFFFANFGTKFKIML